MAENQRVPKELDCSNIATEWPTWKRNFMVYMIANGKIAEPETTKIATFIWLVGTQGANIYNTMFPNDGSHDSLLGRVVIEQVTPAIVGDNGEVIQQQATTQRVQQRSLDDVLRKFDEHCLPQKNVAMESYKFNMIVQKEKQSFNEFETELRTQLRRCEFSCACGASYEDRMLRDRIIIGVHNKKLQLKLLDGRDEPLTRVIETCKIYESANMNRGILDSKQTVATIAAKETEHEDTPAVNAMNRSCFNCGGPWKFGHNDECKAKDINCRACGKKGHFVRMCRKPKNKNTEEKKDTNKESKESNNKKSISTLKWSDVEGKRDDGNKKLENTLISRNKLVCRLNSMTNKRWTKEYRVADRTVIFKIDTGADVNCIPFDLTKKLNIVFEKYHNKNSVYDYSGNKIKIFGTVNLKCIDIDSNIERSAEFIVVDDQSEPILGLETSIKFELIKRLDVNTLVSSVQSGDSFVKRNNDIFTGLGKFPGRFSIHLKENSKPVLHYKKRIPLALLEKLRVELDKLVRDEIISPVDYPTDWVNNLQIVEKPNGKLRICLDPKPLNACIRREHFLIPTIEDLTSKLANMKFFSVFDLSSGFWHMELDENSSDLTTFMTPFGRFKFKRVPFGLNCAPEMFQRKMVEIFGNIPGVLVYFDDIGIYAENEMEHDKIVATIVKRARENNIKFNPEKIQYRKSEIKFMGNIISEGKIRPDVKYGEAILKMKKPTDKNGVLRFLGLLKYLARFIPNLSKQTAELRNLTRNDVTFEWNEKHNMEFENMVRIITSGPILAIYDPSKQVTVQTDASKDGLGCVLIQDGHPVAFASRTLSKSEQKWAQIEKELLAIVFACQRFHFFLYGREFILESDHKPLERLILRDIDDVTKRLQGMFMSLLTYSGMTVTYKPGKEMLVADCLSRAQLPHVSEIDELSGIIHTVTKGVCLSEDNYNHYRDIMTSDKKYTRICEYVKNGWPRHQELDELGRHFFKLQAELHVENELLFYNHRLVIPSELQRKMTKWLHEPHLGIEKTLARARRLYYWPGMNIQIKQLVLSCAICEMFKRNIQKEPLVQEDTPRYPFNIVAMDLFEYAGRDFVAIFDAYSNYLIALKLNNKTSKHIINTICGVFDKIGYPTIMKCDNSPFGSSEFDQFASEYNIKFKFSSPRYPQSNGLAEKGVAIAKNILKRCYEANEADQFQYRLLEYNTTPIASMHLTPSELFFGRLIKTKLPISEDLLVRNSVKEGEVQEKLEKKKKYQKYYYNRGAKALPVLDTGDLVIFKKSGKEWNYGRIVGKVNDRSYIVRDGMDNHFRRNRRFIAKTKNDGINPSELLLEENIGNNTQCNPQNMREVLIIPPVNQTAQQNENNCEVNEPDLTVVMDPDEYISSDEYETAGSDVSEAECDDNNVIPNVTETASYKTRSGRVVRPPQRYGWD